MATKKQIAALQDIIDTAASQPEKSGYAGIIPVNDRFVITNGVVIVVMHNDIQELPHSNNFDLGKKAYGIVTEQIETGDYNLVQSPFGGIVCSSTFRNQLKEHRIPYYNAHNQKFRLISFGSETLNGRKITGYYEDVSVRRAVEAVGGKPHLYIGYPKERNYSAPFLLVESDDPDLMKDGNSALVFPMLIKKNF